jgi:hypothetical protein
VIGFRDQRINIQMPFSFIALLRKYVTRMRMTSFDLPSRSKPDTFGRAFVSFQLRHDYYLTFHSYQDKSLV